MPEGMLRSWVVGRWYPVAGQSRRMSWPRFVAGIKLPKVHTTLDYVKRQFQVERPLIDQTFHTDGLDLFVERYGDLINASREGQQAMKEIISVYLRASTSGGSKGTRRVYRSSSIPSLAIPSDAAPKSDPRVVVMNPAVSFGRPVIAGAGIPVSSIYERYKAGDSVANLAENFNLETAAIQEAIRCEAA
jgi:uncharacterized protein (DUF433 family)